MSEYERLSDEELTDAISRIVVQLNQRLTMQFLSITEELIQYREKFISGQLVELPCVAYNVKECRYQIISIKNGRIYASKFYRDRKEAEARLKELQEK